MVSQQTCLHSRLLLVHTHVVISKACEKLCYLDVPLYHQLLLVLWFMSIPNYCSHGTSAATEITKTGFLCSILFCYGLLCFAPWWLCNTKVLSKHTNVAKKKCHHKTLQPCQGRSVKMYHLYLNRRKDLQGRTSLNVDSVWIVCFTF